MTGHDWPRWAPGPLGTLGAINLREVADGLWVGAFAAHGYPYGVPAEDGAQWSLVYSFNRLSDEEREDYYDGAPLRRVEFHPFEDGQPFPGAILDRVLEGYRAHRAEGSVLLQCAMGLSRSASAAYALLRVEHGLSAEEARRRINTAEAPRWPHPTTLRGAEQWVARRLA